MTDEDSSWKGDDYNIDTYDNGGGRMSVDNSEEGRGASLDMFNRVEEIVQITQVEAETRIYIYTYMCVQMPSMVRKELNCQVKGRVWIYEPDTLIFLRVKITNPSKSKKPEDARKIKKEFG